MINWIKLITCIAMIESGGNPNAINHQENARGMLQMRKLAFIDAQSMTRTNFQHKDVHSPKIAVCMFRAYIAKYLGSKPKLVDVINLWNGGPSRNARPDYMNKVLNLYYN